MKPAYWRVIDAISISMSFVLCFSGFLVMNSELLFDNLAQSPPPSNWYLGLALFLLGIISYVLTLKSGQKFIQETKNWIHIKNVLLLILILLAILNFLLYPPFHII